MYPGARITGFEPNPDQFVLLTRNIEANGLADTRVLQKAVSDKRGTIEFFLNEDNPGSLNMGLVQRNNEAPKISSSTLRERRKASCVISRTTEKFIPSNK